MSDYDSAMLELLKIIWGDGFMSPGGPEAVREIMAEIPLTGKFILDSGCGLGGFDQVLLSLGAQHVTAIDVAPHLLEIARKRIAAAGEDSRIRFDLVAPEAPLPYSDGSFDVVFTKDAWIHVLDKPRLLREVLRVLKPGGWLAGGDWMKGPDPYSADMIRFIELEGIPYHPATLPDYRAMLQAAGFEMVKVADFNDWYCGLAKQELARMKSELFDVMTEKLGADLRDHWIEDWRMQTVVLENGELRPGRLWARKPT